MPSLDEVRSRYERIKPNLMDFYWREYWNEDDVHTDSIEGYRRIGIAYTTLGPDDEYTLRVYLNLVDMQVDYELAKPDGTVDVVDSWKFEDLEALIPIMDFWSFDSIVSPFLEYIKQYPEIRV